MRRELPPKLQAWGEIGESAERSTRREQEASIDAYLEQGLQKGVALLAVGAPTCDRGHLSVHSPSGKKDNSC